MKTAIVLGHGKVVTLPEYVRGIKIAKANLERTFKHGLTGWWPVTGKEIMKQFLNGVHDRINQRAGTSLSDCNLDRYLEKRRQAASCAWCGAEVPPERFNPNITHNTCEDSCQRSLYQ